jgi:putative ABC transport system substrate-binding protein
MNASRTVLAIAVAINVLAVALAAEAQPRIPRIGVISTVSAEYAKPYMDSGRAGLREIGYVEGRTITLEFRFAGGGKLNPTDLANELVALKPDVIVAVGDRAVEAAKQASSTIPIVMVSGGDPVRSGFVASLARPGGNVTGLASVLPEMDTKILGLLKEAVPRSSTFGVLWNPQSHGGVLGYQAMQAGAPGLGVTTLRSMEVRTPEQLDQAIATMAAEHVGGFVVLTDPLTFGQRRRVLEQAVKHRLPAMFEVREFVDDGGLMSYGPSMREMMRRAAVYVDKVLKGAKPADLPVEQPTKFELIINMKTAKALGLTIPPALLLRADQVIE